MGISNNFIEYYKTISNAELLSILEKPADYQDAAIKAAKKEFSDRKLSVEEIKEARQELFEKQIQKIKQREKEKAVEDKIKKAGQALFDGINPFHSAISSTEKNIRIIIFAFGILFLYQSIIEFKIILLCIKGILGSPLENSFYLLPHLLLPIATFMFWKRKMIGWILLASFVVFSTVITIAMLIQSFLWKPSGFATLDNLFPRPSTTSYIIPLILFIWTLYILCKTNIREAFSVDSQKMYASIAISGLLTLLLMALVN
jgi:hypothetical protein